MTREEVLHNVQEVFRDIFDDDKIEISEHTSAKDIDEWDSLNHINLVSAIEQEFQVRFTLRELQSLKDVGGMINLMMEKIES